MPEPARNPIGAVDSPGGLSEVPRPDTAKSLVHAAVEAFSHSGYDGVSIRDIERKAGINRGLAAYHFGTKEALWDAALEYLMEEFEAEWARYREFLPLVSAQERGRVLLRIYVRFVAKHPEFFRLLLLHGESETERAKVLVERYLRRLVEFFHRVSGEEEPSGEQAAIDHFMFVGAASMIFATPAQCELLFGVDPTTEQFIERFADQIADRGLHHRS
ncbi:MAG: TetR/AcrR family transcriptional regulator [Solirubrobacteraceae bacterium]